MNCRQVCERIIGKDERMESVWTKVFNVLYQKLSNNTPNYEFDIYLNANDYNKIWKWIIDDYSHNYPYKAEPLDTIYYKNPRIQDEFYEYLPKAPTNLRRSFKYYTGFMKYRVGRKEKEIINNELTNFFNSICNERPRPSSSFLTPLVTLYYENNQAYNLSRQELDEIISQSKLPNDLSAYIHSYLGGKKNKSKKYYKLRKHKKSKKIKTHKKSKKYYKKSKKIS